MIIIKVVTWQKCELITIKCVRGGGESKPPPARLSLSLLKHESVYSVWEWHRELPRTIIRHYEHNPCLQGHLEWQLMKGDDGRSRDRQTDRNLTPFSVRVKYSNTFRRPFLHEHTLIEEIKPSLPILFPIEDNATQTDDVASVFCRCTIKNILLVHPQRIGRLAVILHFDSLLS